MGVISNGTTLLDAGALDRITFFFSSGNQAGTIKMYGIK